MCVSTKSPTLQHSTSCVENRVEIVKNFNDTTGFIFSTASRKSVGKKEGKFFGRCSLDWRLSWDIESADRADLVWSNGFWCRAVTDDILISAHKILSHRNSVINPKSIYLDNLLSSNLSPPQTQSSTLNTCVLSTPRRKQSSFLLYESPEQTNKKSENDFLFLFCTKQNSFDFSSLALLLFSFWRRFFASFVSAFRLVLLPRFFLIYLDGEAVFPRNHSPRPSLI